MPIADARRDSRRSVPLALLIVAAAAAVAAPLIATGFDFRIFTLEATSAAAKAQLWLILLGVEAAVWVLIVAWMAQIIKMIRSISPLPAKMLLTQTVLPLLILSLPAFLSTLGGRGHSHIPPSELPPYSISNLPVIGRTGILVAMLCVFTMYMSRCAAVLSASGTGLGLRMQALIELHTYMRTSLLCASATLGLGTLAGAALRDSANAAAGKDIFPAEYVIAYGVTFSIFLALAYFPIQWQFFQLGSELVREYAGTPGESPESTSTWYEKTTKAQAMLGTGWTGLTGISSALLALGPAMLGLISHLLSAK
jgi:hypothetical protein